MPYEDPAGMVLYCADLYLCDPHTMIRNVGKDRLQDALCCYGAHKLVVVKLLSYCLTIKLFHSVNFNK